MCDIRLLRGDEIDVRAQQVLKTQNGVGAILLLYKNARCDMAILDEVFGMRGWQREHSFKDGKNYCRVSIWDDDKQLWIAKEDVGTESNTEAEKGEASDAFKRACFNVGIGRELYTAPFIYVSLSDDEWTTKEDRGKAKYYLKNKVRFEVDTVTYDALRNITGLVIVDQSGRERFRLGGRNSTAPIAPQPVPKAPRRNPNPAVSPQQPVPKAPQRTPQIAPNPIELAPEAPKAQRNRVTAEMLDDQVKCNCLLEWAYGFWTMDGYSAEFDAGKRLLKSYDATAEVVERFTQLFESYKQAKSAKKAQ